MSFSASSVRGVLPVQDCGRAAAPVEVGMMGARVPQEHKSGSRLPAPLLARDRVCAGIAYGRAPPTAANPLRGEGKPVRPAPPDGLREPISAPPSAVRAKLQ